jgi:hypothetical protein
MVPLLLNPVFGKDHANRRREQLRHLKTKRPSKALERMDGLTN